MTDQQVAPSYGKDTFFSQNGEDFLLSKLFEPNKPGFFVEIGCIDGLRFSNTLYFERNGWSGLCVEAHADYIEMLKKNRPGSIVEHAAVGETDRETVDFFANARGSLSTLDKTMEHEFTERFGKWFTGFEVQQTRMLSLNTIFKKHGITEIDILSIDIEGYEVQALQGLNLEIYRPRVMVIESDTREHTREVEKILFPAGYSFIASIAVNFFYALEPGYRDIIGEKRFENVPMLNTQHPLDSDGDLRRVLTIETK